MKFVVDYGSFLEGVVFNGDLDMATISGATLTGHGVAGSRGRVILPS